MAVNPEYAGILRRDPKLQVWYEFHSGVLLNEVRDPRIRTEMENIIHRHLKFSTGIRRDLTLPRVIWTSHSSNVLNITGQPFAVPTMIFTPDQQALFQAIAGENTAGLTLTFPIEYASRGRLNHTDATDSKIVLLRDSSIPSVIHPHETSQHEFTHAIDPLVDSRPKEEELVLSELIAIVGSYADTNAKDAGITLHPPYILPYLLKEQTNQHLSYDEIISKALLINALVFNMTHTNPKLPNDAITRRLMACRSLGELKSTWPAIFPGYQNPDSDWTIRPRPVQ
jgi:hypothetical protein